MGQEDSGVVAKFCLKADNVHRILPGPVFELQKKLSSSSFIKYNSFYSSLT